MAGVQNVPKITHLTTDNICKLFGWQQTHLFIKLSKIDLTTMLNKFLLNLKHEYESQKNIFTSKNFVWNLQKPLQCKGTTWYRLQQDEILLKTELSLIYLILLKMKLNLNLLEMNKLIQTVPRRTFPIHYVSSWNVI